MANCKFEEAINKMKDLLQKHLGGRLTSEATKEILKAKLDGLKDIELQVRKLQGTVRVTSNVVSSTNAIKLLRWDSKNNTIVDAKGNTSIKVNSLKELTELATEYHDILTDKLGNKDVDFQKHKEYFLGLFKQLEDAGIKFKPVTVQLTKNVTNDDLVHAYSSKGKIELSTSKVYENRYPLKIVLHEYAHIITMNELKKYPELANRAKEIMNNVLRQYPELVKEYWFKDEYEFIAEVISSPRFQTQLASAKSDGKSSIVDKVKKIFNYLLNKVNAKEINALTDALEVVVGLTISTVNTPNGIDKAINKYKNKYGNSDDISWMKEDSKGYNGKIDVTDPVASMKVAKEMELQKERNKELLHMVEYPSWKSEKVMEDIHNKNYKDTREVLDSIILQVAKPGMEERAISTLLNYTLDNKEIIAGTYNAKDHIINMSTLTGEQASEHARALVLEKYMDKVYGKKNMDVEEYAVKAEKLANSKEYKEVIKKEQQKEAINIVNAFIAAKGSHAVSHELIHAGAVRYMRDNPNSELTQRINELYNIAMKHEEAVHGSMGKGYWMTNVDEFLAETLTNPVTIKYMNSIKVDGSRRGPSVFDKVIDAVLAMIGFKKESTVYQEALNSYAGILEQVSYAKEGTDLENAANKAVESLKMKQLLLQGMKDC
jgi:hypothetical protein